LRHEKSSHSFLGLARKLLMMHQIQVDKPGRPNHELPIEERFGRSSQHSGERNLRRFFGMTRKVLLLSGVLALSLGTNARADFITTNATIQSPAAGAPVGNVFQLSGSAGLSYTNPQATPALGVDVRAIGAVRVDNYTLGSGATNSVTVPGHNVVAVFALQGTSRAPSGGVFTADFSRGAVQIFDIGSTVFNPRDPATWGVQTPGATLLSSYTLNTPNMNTAGNGITGANIFIPANQQNVASANTDLTTHTGGNFQLDKLTDNLLTSPQPFTNQQLGIDELLTTNTNPFSAAQELQVNNIFDALLPGIPGSFSRNETFNPNPGSGFANGDTIQALSFNSFPTFIPVIPGGVPEPASILLWGAVTAGIGVWGSARRLRKV
jgi:hypothetical protein